VGSGSVQCDCIVSGYIGVVNIGVGLGYQVWWRWYDP
jgi:hypothetical protein